MRVLVLGETYLSDCGVQICTANELIARRANLYRSLYPECNMICGDITNPDIFDSVIKSASGADFMKFSLCAEDELC